jgi:GNAT superfamily N-acetyltransferase
MEGEIMTDETLKQYILDYKPKNRRDIQITKMDGYDFTFLIQDGKAIGVVLDMTCEPHLYVLEEYRGYGYGSRLLKKYLVEKKLIGSNKYVYYNAGTDDGEKLINSFRKHNHEFKVIEVDKRKYIILKDSRF